MDTYGKPASLSYATNTPVTAAGLLNDRVLPFLEQHAILLTRVLTDRQRNTDCPPYELYRALEDTDHSRTKRKAHTPNWICERFNKTLLNEFDRVVFRKRLYRLLEPMPAALDAFLEEYNTQRPHPGR